jgi:MFS transporter, putative metabolite:H+ symporter
MSMSSLSAPSVASRFERLPVTSYQKYLFVIIATAWLFDSMDLGMMSFVLGSIRTDFHLSTAQAGLLGSASFLGMFVGAAVSGLLADRFGRRVVFQWSMVVWGLGSFLCAAASDINVLLACRVALGIGMGMEFPIGQAILAEFMPATKRGRYVALLEGFWPIGFICAGVLSYFILPLWGWRGVFVALGIPSIFVLIVRRAVPESPRWLESRGRVDEASDIMSAIERKVAAAHGGPLPEIAIMAIAPKEARVSAGFQELWRGPYAKRTVMLWMLWFFALLGYYGLTTWLSALLQQAGFAVTKSVFYTVLISLAGVPGFLVSAWLVEKWGRKPTCVFTLVGSACMAYLYGRVAGQGGSPALFVPFGLGMQFFMFGMWSVLYAYTPELYPTRCRATGGGFASAIGRVGSLIGPYVVGVILPATGQFGVFAIGAGCFLLAAAVVWLLGEETKGQMLERVSP